MRHSDGAAVGNLLLKNGHHTARRAEHVAKPHRHEAGFARPSGHVEALQHELREALGGAHDVRGVDGLVG